MTSYAAFMKIGSKTMVMGDTTLLEDQVNPVMSVEDSHLRMAILCSGNREARRNTTAENSRFSDLFRAFAARRIHVEPAIYHDDFCEDIREQLMQVDGVLVWVNPIEGGRDRSVLDSMLRDVAATGVFVSTHPNVILKLGTKEVLYRTRHVGWGCDTHLYCSMAQMVQELPLRLTAGKARVLSSKIAATVEMACGKSSCR